MPEAATRPVTDTTVYWFVKLELAVESGDLEAALHAQQQLKRLGVAVEYHGLQPREVTDAAR
jgi:hypothetical protein